MCVPGLCAAGVTGLSPPGDRSHHVQRVCHWSLCFAVRCDNVLELTGWQLALMFLQRLPQSIRGCLCT